jgi:DNA-binding XRE family transcriptional regulator
MGRTLGKILAALPKGRRRKVEARAKAIIAEEMSLQDLRKALHQTQVHLAKTLGVGQDSVSRIEQRTDMLLSTLHGYVNAMGGELHLIAEFPGRPPVRLRDVGTLADRRFAASRIAARTGHSGRAGR